jgi:hypothetical protein
MSAKHHNEWLSLLEISGPFLSIPVLLRVFPNGLDTVDADLRHLLREAYEEWADNQRGLQPEVSIHTAWLRFVMQHVLGMQVITDRTGPGLVTGSALPPSVRRENGAYGQQILSVYALVSPDEERPRLLIQHYPFHQDLNAPLREPARNGKREPYRADPPAEQMTHLLRETDIRLGLITNGEQWMLIDAPRNEATAYITWQADLWHEEPLTLRALHSLLHLRRFFGVAPNDTLEALLRESAEKQHEVTDQLGYQVRRAVEVLIHTLDRIDRKSKRTLLATVNETEVYNAVLTVMMRLVFLLSAEERKLLPLGEKLYDEYYAASTLQSKLRELADQVGEELLEQRQDAWCRLLALFRVIYNGAQHPDMKMLAYDGRLFDPDRYPFLEGRATGTNWLLEQAEPPAIDNRTVLHLLEALQLLEVEVPGGGTETRRLSFLSLGVEQIGHVYEGLLDHTARRADQPILSLRQGGKRQEGVEVALATLEELAAKSKADLLAFLEKQTSRSQNALLKDLAFTPTAHRLDILKSACGGDKILLHRVLPFAGLLRDDTTKRPLIFSTGALYMTVGPDRRATGTHYTPTSLTDPLVRHTLEPLVYRGLAEGIPREQCRLISVQELLELKICDFAMGSGAFLVQACRYLAHRLIEAWEELEWSSPGQLFTIEGQPATGMPGETLLPSDREERLIAAQRLVAERCLYGVDKNPMATEMAKLSLWLITLYKDRPFTFLDHALSTGDSLLGVSIKQLKNWSLDPNTSEDEIRQNSWVQEPIRRTLNQVLIKRRRLRALIGDSIQNVEEKARLLKQATEAMELIRLGADLLIATTLHDLGKSKQRNEQNGNNLPTMIDYLLLLDAFETAHREHLNEEAHRHNQFAFEYMRARVDATLGKRRPFHWPLMFPEVFFDERITAPGFTALLSNPPFQGGQRITGTLGTDYRDYLVEYLAFGKRGSADLCAYFFLRASDIVQQEGQAGLVATNTIAQGDTREVGLEQIVAKGWTIPRAIPSRKWPGEAALEIAHVWLRHGNWQSEYKLDDQPASGITPSLSSHGMVAGKPFRLIANQDKSYIGSYVLGMGFVLEPQEAQQLLEKDPRNTEVLFPYLNGEDLNSRPDQSPSRWVINFFDWSLEQTETYPDCMAIIREKVKPERELNNDKRPRESWWLFKRPTLSLYNAIAGLERVLAIALTSHTCAFTFVPSSIVFSHATGIFAFDDFCYLSILQSVFHVEWAFKYASSMKGDLRYTPSDCFETFPFPINLPSLEEIGQRYYEHRQTIMLTRQEGLTKTYNRFHNPQETSADIVKLRELHQEMDEAVAAAYGWNDLALAHSFYETRQGLRYTISEEARREALDRLLRLNHERYAEEVAQGLHDKATKTKRVDRKASLPANVTKIEPLVHAHAQEDSTGRRRRVAERRANYQGRKGRMSTGDSEDIAGDVETGEVRQPGLFDDVL